MLHQPLNNIDLEAVEREIAARRLSLKFPPAIETAFAGANKRARIMNMLITSTVAAALYDAFLFDDWLVMHDRFPEMVVSRLLIFTPFIIGMKILAYRKNSTLIAEWATVAAGCLAVLLPMSVMVFSNSTHKLSYQYGSVLVMMFATVIQRVRFRPAAVAVVAILIIQLTADRLANAFDAETYTAIVSFFGAAAVLQILSVYNVEKADRRTFLFVLRGRFLRDQLLVSARTDALTGLYNRRHLADFSREVWTDDEPRQVCAILLDIDHFKLFNDTCGHLKGDDCLRTISACLLAAAPVGGGATFRFGGEEMLLMLPGIDPLAARDIAEDIRRAIAAAAIPHPALGDHAIVTASFGVAGVMAPDASADTLVAAADTALYAAKRAGRDCIWPPAPRAEMVTGLRLARTSA